jgi:hypothetical protein
MPPSRHLVDPAGATTAAAQARSLLPRTTMPAERRGVPRADVWEGTMEAIITREEPRRSRTPGERERSGQPAPAADVAPRYRKAAITVGLLFIIGDVAGVLSLLVTRGLLDGPNVLTKVAANQSQLALGALLVLAMGFALAMIPVVMYPIFKKFSEVLALGTVVFRSALETVGYIASAGAMLLLVELSRQDTAASAGAPQVHTLSGLLVTAQGSIATWLVSIAFSLGALMFYYLFYQSRLIPRWLSVWGLVGAALYLAAPVLDMFGRGSGLLMGPLAVAEIVLAAWLIVRGLDWPESTETLA